MIASSFAEANPGNSNLQSVLKTGLIEKDVSAILLPLGPEDGRLPGFPRIWKEILQSEDGKRSISDSSGFDGLQAVDNVRNLSKSAVASLFLSSNALQVFRLGESLLVLNSQGDVQIVNSTNPRQPKLTGYLPYHNVKHMELQGNIAYLLLSHPTARSDSMIVIMLEKLEEPLELARLDLSKNALSFYLSGRRLVVYFEDLGNNRAPTAAMYELTGDNQLLPVGSGAYPSLANGFWRYDDYLLIPDSKAGLHIYAASDPLQPAKVTFLDLPGKVRYLVRNREKIFALDNLKRIFVIDFHEPEHPVLLVTEDRAEYPVFILGNGNYAYYFTFQGYLYVFERPLLNLPARRGKGGDGLAGALLDLPDAAGFTLLGSSPRELSEGADGIVPLADANEIIDAVVWQGGLVTLQTDGCVRFFRSNSGSLAELQSILQLPQAQRWLIADDDLLYVGGSSSVTILASGGDHRLTVAEQVDLPVAKTWDGLIVGEVLCMAAGDSGIVCLSLSRSGHPLSMVTLDLPLYLLSQVDVRQLASSGGSRIFAAAGPAGLLDGRIEDDGQFHLNGLFAFPTPVSAVAVLNRLCLVATKNDVRVVDVRDDKSLQSLGEILFSGVSRLAVAPPGYWSGFVPGAGWSVMHAPHLLSTGELALLLRADDVDKESDQAYYRLNLFDDRNVTAIPGILSLSARFGGPNAGVRHYDR